VAGHLLSLGERTSGETGSVWSEKNDGRNREQGSATVLRNRPYRTMPHTRMVKERWPRYEGAEDFVLVVTSAAQRRKKNLIENANQSRGVV
jgi:hypothetical protein